MGTLKYGDFKRKMEALRIKPQVIFNFKGKKTVEDSVKKGGMFKDLKRELQCCL